MSYPQRFICFRYRLSTLFVFTLLIAMGASAWGYHVRAVHRQEAAFRTIVSKGGRIHVRVEGTFIMFNNPTGFVCGTGLLRVIGPDPHGLQVGDEDVIVFDDVLNLRSVDFSGTSVSQAGRENFRQRNPKCNVN